MMHISFKNSMTIHHKKLRAVQLILYFKCKDLNNTVKDPNLHTSTTTCTHTQSVGIWHMLLCSLPVPPSPHSFIHSFFHAFTFTLTMNLNFRLSSDRMKRDEKGGEGAFFSSSKPTLWPHDLQTTLPSSCLLNSQLQNPQHIQFLRYDTTWIWQSWKGRQKKWTHGHKSPHLPVFCLICYFCTLHSSTDGLSIDFDLFRLRLALCVSMCLCGVGVEKLLLLIPI